ncbi:uncharacterized protein ACJ7VT_018548 [Polymixia lowei]
MNFRKTLIFVIVISSSSTLKIKGNLTCTVGGSITLPDPVKKLGTLLYEVKGIAFVTKKENMTMEESFMDRLLWDKDTGLFTITRLQTNDSGIYRIDPKDGGVAASYHLSVYESVPMPGVKVSSVNSENCTLLCFVEQHGQTVLYWYKGEEILNQTSTLPSLPLTVDKQGLIPSYICVAANPADRKSLSVNVTTSCREENKTDPTEPVPMPGVNVSSVNCSNCSRGQTVLTPVIVGSIIVVGIIIIIIIIIITSICVVRKRDRSPQGKGWKDVADTDTNGKTSIQLLHLLPPSTVPCPPTPNGFLQGEDVPLSAVDRSNLTTV